MFSVYTFGMEIKNTLFDDKKNTLYNLRLLLLLLLFIQCGCWIISFSYDIAPFIQHKSLISLSNLKRRRTKTHADGNIFFSDQFKIGRQNQQNYIHIYTLEHNFILDFCILDFAHTFSNKWKRLNWFERFLGCVVVYLLEYTSVFEFVSFFCVAEIHNNFVCLTATEY